ncbi:PREDICTED: pentatricopeptide repeat-containing protein At4g32430, mitochondrial [Fragaria vesca subsp. vesca]|uniref:pentatricopeptide repeat-containing protein At4g32430, mitochondrial n=1 Tax=Fragaria vesca subsp. vesca TaxID=101020 RepID=UPI0002C31F10|nr:PREDICTED: pentatricopeptide repeat-containing protein At4g32430, mitochondrial [Fragaria vesca subsp. vesca]
MITRQLNFKTLQRIRKPRLTTSTICSKFHSYNHEHHLFDEIPQPDAAAVNRSMLNYMHRNLSATSLDIFTKQFQHFSYPCNIDEVTVTLAVKACQGDPKPGCQIHGFAVSSGFISYVTVSNSLMSMYNKAGRFDSAMCIFDGMCYTDIVSWNTVLSGFRTSEGALSFACRMHSNGIALDPVTYCTVLAFCGEYEDFLFGLQLHSLVFKSGLDCEVFVGNALISMYSRWRRLREARNVFDEMRKRDVVSWNAILSGYSQERNHGLEAIILFIEMVREGMKLDHVSFTSAVSACGHEKNLRLGRQIHGLTVKSGYESHVSVGNVLISTYSKSGVNEDAGLVFQHLKNRNVISWTTMISMDEENAISLFNKMRLDGVYPNEVTFVGLIHAISNRKLVEEGLMIHGFCRKTGFLSKHNVCNSFITMYAQFESMDDSFKVFEELDFREIISWNALISGYAQNKLCQDALRTFLSAIMESTPNNYTFGSVLSAIGDAHDISLKYGQRCHSFLIKLGSVTDPITAGALLDMYAKRGSICESQRVFSETPHRTQFAWTAIISAYAGHGDYDSVVELFYQMDKEGVKPDSITFLSVLSACSRKGSVEMGRHFFESMVKDYQIVPSPQHYASMVDMLGRAGKLEEAEELMSQMSGQPSFSLLQSLLGACTIHGNVEMAERVAGALMRMEPTESGSYVLLSNLYAEKGDWEMVAKIRRQMRDRGVRKEVGYSWLDNGDADGSLYLHGFSSGDKSHCRSEEICRMAKFLGLEMKFLRENMSDIDSVKQNSETHSEVPRDEGLY